MALADRQNNPAAQGPTDSVFIHQINFYSNKSGKNAENTDLTKGGGGTVGGKSLAQQQMNRSGIINKKDMADS